MNKTQEQLEKLREVAEASLTKTEELQKVLAQIEALMSREESQKVSQKNKLLPLSFLSLAVALEIQANHLQITYYLLLMLIIWAISFSCNDKI